MEKCLAYDIYRAYGLIKMVTPKRKTFEDRLARQFYRDFDEFEETYDNDYEELFNFGDWYILETYSGGVLELVARIVGHMITKKPILLSLNNKSIKRLYSFYNSLQYISFEEALCQFYSQFTIDDVEVEEEKISGLKVLIENYKEIAKIKFNMFVNRLKKEKVRL